MKRKRRLTPAQYASREFGFLTASELGTLLYHCRMTLKEKGLRGRELAEQLTGAAWGIQMAVLALRLKAKGAELGFIELPRPDAQTIVLFERDSNRHLVLRDGTVTDMVLNSNPPVDPDSAERFLLLVLSFEDDW